MEKVAAITEECTQMLQYAISNQKGVFLKNAYEKSKICLLFSP